MTTNDSNENNSSDQLYNVINEKLESLSVIKFAAYRVACKLRALQKYLKLCYVDYTVLTRAFNVHQWDFGADIESISLKDAKNVLTDLYQLISSYHFNEFSIDNVVETVIRIFTDILERKSDENFDFNSFKILLFALSSAKLPEKYQCFFRQMTAPNTIATQRQLATLLHTLLKLPNHFDDVDSFYSDNVPACVQSCLDHTHDGEIREELFISWMSHEPQTLVWLPTLHRLIATETVRHEAQCNICKAYPVIGMRYRCLRCFNYDLCQTCFFTGDDTKNHNGSHPIEEYCKQVTPLEDLKAFFEFMKLKIGKTELKRKGRFLTIERSKSFSDASGDNKSNQSAPKEHHSLTRHEQSTKNTQHQDDRQPTAKIETNRRSAHDEQKHSANRKHDVSNGDTKIEKTKARSTNRSENKHKDINSNSKQVKNDTDDENPPIIMPKQSKTAQIASSNKQRATEFMQSEHYQLPPQDKINSHNGNNKHHNDDDDDDDGYRPPLPPKQRHQTNASRALVYDFIGNELQELRETLAQFDKNSSVD